MKSKRDIANFLTDLSESNRVNLTESCHLANAAELIMKHVPSRTDVTDGETRAYMLRWLLNANHEAELENYNYSYADIKQLYLKYHG